VPSQNNTHDNYQRCIERGRAFVEQYAAQSNEYGTDTEEHTSVAGDLIGDVLAYIGELPATDLPPIYQTTQVSRFGCVAARGVWDVLTQQAQLIHDGDEPDPADMQEAVDVFADYLQRA
jgi:hypothetical protein